MKSNTSVVSITSDNSDHKLIIHKKQIKRIEETELLLKTPPKADEPSKFLRNFLIVISLLSVISLFYFLLIKNGLLNRLRKYFVSSISEIYKTHPILVLIILFILQFISMTLLLPMHSILTFVVCSIIQNFWFSFFYILGCSIISSIFIFYLCMTKLKPFLYKKFNSNPFLEIIRKKSKSNPYRIAFLTRFLFIAAGIKDYILGLIENPFWSFLISAITAHAFFIFEVLLVHKEFMDISNRSDNSYVPWGKKTLTQKVSSIFFWILLLFTIGVMVYLGYEAKKFIDNEKEKEKIENQKNDLQSKSEIITSI